MSKKQSAVAFLRVSSLDQREGFSLDAQEKLSDKYAKENNLLIVKDWRVNESASKENDRKFFFEMIEYVKANGVKDIVFDKVDRACRGMKSAQMIEELIEEGTRFHFTRDQLVVDSNSPSSEKLRFYLHVILAKYYIDNLKTEIKKGLDEREEAGFWNHKAPIGYKNIRRDSAGKISEDRKGRAFTEVDEKIAPAIREVFQLYATGNYTLEKLASFLNGQFERLGEKRKIVKNCIEHVLANPFYYGDMRTRGHIIAGKHQPLIEKSLWDACQKIRGLRAEKFEVRNAKLIPKPYMGLLHCGVCGHAITGESKRKASGRTYVYYRCANHQCPEKRRSIPQTVIEQQLVAAFDPFAKFTPVATKAFIEGIQGSLENLELYTHEQMHLIATHQYEVKKNMERIERLHRSGQLSNEEYESLLKQKKAALVASEVEIQATIKTNGNTFEAGLKVIELLKKANGFMNLPGNELEKARLAKLVLSNPKLENGTLRYDYQKPFDVLIELTSKKIGSSPLMVGRK